MRGVNALDGGGICCTSAPGFQTLNWDMIALFCEAVACSLELTFKGLKPIYDLLCTKCSIQQARCDASFRTSTLHASMSLQCWKLVSPPPKEGRSQTRVNICPQSSLSFFLEGLCAPREGRGGKGEINGLAACTKKIEEKRLNRAPLVLCASLSLSLPPCMHALERLHFFSGESQVHTIHLDIGGAFGREIVKVLSIYERA